MIPIILAALVGIGSSTPDVRMDEHGRWHFNWIDQDRFGLSRYGTDGWERIPDVELRPTEEDDEKIERRQQELEQEIDDLRAELRREREWNTPDSLDLGGLSLEDDDE